MATVSIIGFGIMGQVAAKMLMEKGHTVLAYDAFGPAKAKAQALGVQLVDTPARGAELSEIVILFLPGPVQIEECVLGPEGLLKGAPAGLVIVDMCTSTPNCTEKMAAEASKCGVGYIDAPVLGRPIRVGHWALPIGGDATHIEKARPVLEAVAAKIMPMGAVGAGHKVKLLNQMMFGAINAMTAEMMAVASKVGVDPALLYETITASQAGTVSNLFVELGARVRDDHYTDPAFSVDMLAKDVRLGLAMAQECGASPILGRTVDFLNESARSQGQGSLDTSCMWKAVKHFWE